MPDVQEVFRMATQKVRPDPGAMERQSKTQRRQVVRQRAGGYALLAVLIVAGVVIAVTALGRNEVEPASQPGEGEAPAGTAEGAPFAVEALQGIWLEDRGTGQHPDSIMARFGSDRTFSMGGATDQDAWLSGQYEVDGHMIRFTVSGGDCAANGAVFTWVGGIVTEGRLETEHRGTVDGGNSVGNCGIPIGEPYNFTRVSPTSPAAPDIQPGYYTGPSGPITQETNSVDLQGFWLVEATGHLLQIEWSGSYRLDDAGQLAEAPRDAGNLEIGRRTLTFTSGGAATGCAEGDVLVLGNARVREGGIEGTVSQDSCGRGIQGPIRLMYLDVSTP
jgi:hypothetical protein